MDYLHFTPEGHLITFVFMPMGFGPKEPVWHILWYSCYWNEHDELIVRYHDRASQEMTLIVQQPDPDNLLFYRANAMPLEWRYQQVSWTTMPERLEMTYAEALRRITKHQAEKAQAV